MQCSSQVFGCRAFPTAAAKSQSQKPTLLPPIPQTLFLLQSRSAPKSVSVYGYPAGDGSAAILRTKLAGLISGENRAAHWLRLSYVWQRIVQRIVSLPMARQEENAGSRRTRQACAYSFFEVSRSQAPIPPASCSLRAASPETTSTETL